MKNTIPLRELTLKELALVTVIGLVVTALSFTAIRHIQSVVIRSAVTYIVADLALSVAYGTVVAVTAMKNTRV